MFLHCLKDFMRFVFVIFLCLFTVCHSSSAAEMPFEYIEGVPCVSVEISSGDQSVKAHLILDLGLSEALLLHSDFPEVLEIDTEAKLTISYDDGQLTVSSYYTSDLTDIDEFSRRNAASLGEIPVWGYLGVKAFDSGIVSMDISNKVANFGDIEIPENAAKIPLKIDSGRFIADIEPDEGYILKAVIATSEFDTVFDLDAASLSGSETADFEHCRFADLNLREFTAVRAKQDLSTELTIGDCVIANSFWQNFVVYYRQEDQSLYFSELLSGRVSDLNEQNFFNAFVSEDIDEIYECVNQYPESRLISEAYNLILKYSVDSGIEEDIKAAITNLLESQDRDNASNILLFYAEGFLQESDYDSAKLMLAYAKDELTSVDQHPLKLAKVNTWLGQIALAEDDLTAARRYLMSAVFANPSDCMANYYMGNYYENSGDMVRAWARYLKSFMRDDTFEQAFTALIRISSNSDFQQKFTADDVIDFLDGHIYDEEGSLTKSANFLKFRGGELFKTAIARLEDQHGK